ncbi:MAG: UTP--glucose-1-phosphate uridylyltransferase [Spirochaetota bacterium]
MKQIHSKDFSQQHIDEELTRSVLNEVRVQEQESTTDNSATYNFPDIDGKQIIDGSGEVTLELPLAEAKRALEAIDPTLHPADVGTPSGDVIRFTSEQLTELGYKLTRYTAYGVLNGGSATSYIDIKKNSEFYPPLFDIIQKPFERLAALCKDRPKGLTPAYINPDGSPGYSFLELKMRALLVLELRAMRKTGTAARIPMFQMTSDVTHDKLLAAFESYRHSPMLEDLIRETGDQITDVLSAKQPLIAALTPASEGFPRDIFTKAYGKEGQLLPLPGGHGQNFMVLKDIYRSLYREGYRFAYLVNVDNIGNFPSPLFIALTALTGGDGSFEFSYKSPVDLKGGVLLRSEHGKLTCRDIGVAISPQDVTTAEKQGKPVLFNCATGLFNLSYLNDNLEYIIKHLPLRVSEQNKDAGTYAQAEQITWEVMDLMDHPAVIAVDKHKRFLAAKLLSESIAATQASTIVPQLREQKPEYEDFCTVSLQLEKGFFDMMKHAYQMRLEDGVWKPLKAEEIGI